MRKVLYILTCCLAAACTSFDKGNPYQEAMQTLSVRLVYPDEYASYCREGVGVLLRDQNTTNRYAALTDKDGCAEFRVTTGIYRLSVLDKPEAKVVFNGLAEQLELTRGEQSLELKLRFAKPGSIVIREAYFGGCPALPAEGTYMRDKYVILHNNDLETQYLDNICVGVVDPYNSGNTSGNPWTEVIDGQVVFPDYAPVPDCVWQLPGSGTDFPLAPGADAVIALNGAVDHTQTYPMSVDLNNSAYFLCYDLLAYNQTQSVLYYPTPGDQTLESHQLKVVKKTGTNASATSAISQNSPAMIVYRAPSGFDLDTYLSNDLESVAARNSLRYTKIPWSWVVDGVEVFSKSGVSNVKRLHSEIDAGYVEFSASGLGHTVHRRLDEEASQGAGYEIYVDTNNSSNDFYERETQSLRHSL